MTHAPGQHGVQAPGRGRGQDAGRQATAPAEARERASHPGDGRRPRSGRRRPSADALRAHRRRGLRRLAVLLASVFGLGWLTYLLLVSSVFGARSVDVTGTVLLTADEVRAAAAVPAGRPLLRLDVDEVATRVRGLAPVADVQVERSWPTTVTVRVTERVPVAFVTVPEGARLVDGAGRDFTTVGAPPPGLPELHAVSGEATTAAATVLAALAEPGREGLRAEVLAVRAHSTYDIQLTLRGDRTVRWGSAADSGDKAAVLAVLLSQPGTVYDVASPRLPTIR